MTWGIMVTECAGRYSPMTMVCGEWLNDLRQRICNYGINYIAGRNEISDDEIDELSKNVIEVIKRKNDGEGLDLRKELNGLGLILGD